MNWKKKLILRVVRTCGGASSGFQDFRISGFQLDFRGFLGFLNFSKNPQEMDFIKKLVSWFLVVTFHPSISDHGYKEMTNFSIPFNFEANP
jgi:hypothetical protein